MSWDELIGSVKLNKKCTDGKQCICNECSAKFFKNLREAYKATKNSNSEPFA